MKRVVASAGIFAVGFAGLRAQNVTGLTTQEQEKWWVLSGSLRGFYDDNSLNAPDSIAEPSTGFEFHPGISLNFPLERTLFSASYDFTLNYYQDRPSEKMDQSHVFDARANHRFSQRYEVNIENNFIYADEPAVFDVTTVQRRGDSSGLRNQGLIDLSGRMTPLIGLVGGYRNNLRNYNQTGPGSYSALFDSLEHLLHVDVQWYQSEKMFHFAGYQFGAFNYTSSDLIGYGPDPRESSRPGSTSTNNVAIYPDSRNNRSHYFYVGSKRNFSEKLESTIKVGIQYTDYVNANDSTWSPYLDLRATYTYLPGSSAQAGLSVLRIPADVGIVNTGDELTLDSLASSFYASVNHRFGYRLLGSLSLNFQHTTYNGGAYDGESNDYLTIDSRAEYKLREYLFLDLGYVWYLYNSSIPGVDFTRNRVYFGVRATY